MDLLYHLNSRFLQPLWMKYKDIDYRDVLRDIREFHKKSLDEIRSYQLLRIQKLLRHCYENVPYYRTEWDNIGLRPCDIHNLEDIATIPVLTKKKIRSNYKDLFSRDSMSKKLIVSGTGGTTDSPITIKYDKKRAKVKDAEMHYFREWWGWNLGVKHACLWGAPQDIPNIKSLKYKLRSLLIDRFLILFSAFINDKIMNEYVNKLNRFKPVVIQGYSNALFLLANHIINNEIKIYSPKSVIVTAEPCTAYQRKTIENAFNSEVFSFYGAREAGYIGVECGRRKGFHLNCYGLYVEFINHDNHHCHEDEIGRIILTDLYNFDMPFIRYEIGDMGSPDFNSCDCGSPLPLMNFFAGRETDVFIMPDGSYVPGISLCDRIVTDCKGIEQLQFIQNSIEELHVKIVKGASYSEADMVLLDKDLNSYFKGKLKIRKEFVSDIPKEKSGKTRFCISNVSTNDLKNGKSRIVQ